MCKDINGIEVDADKNHRECLVYKKGNTDRLSELHKTRHSLE